MFSLKLWMFSFSLLSLVVVLVLTLYLVTPQKLFVSLPAQSHSRHFLVSNYAKDPHGVSFTHQRRAIHHKLQKSITLTDSSDSNLHSTNGTLKRWTEPPLNITAKLDSGKRQLALPVPYATLPTYELIRQQWVGDLIQILSKIPQKSPPIHLVTCNYKYRDVVLNWLIAAKIRADPPVTNIIVLSLDLSLYSLMSERHIPCVHIEPEHFLAHDLEPQPKPSRQVFILRLTVVRLLNYLGYDAASFDADAIIVKNPEELYRKYSDSDMVAAYGSYPFELAGKWGATICGGTFMVRSTKNSGEFIASSGVDSTNRMQSVSPGH